MNHLRALIRMLLLALVVMVPSFSTSQNRTTPTAEERTELLSVRQQVWESYFSNNQAKLDELIGEDFLTINPGEQHWQNRDEFLAGAKAFASRGGKLASLTFSRTEIQRFGDVAVLYSQLQITMETHGKQQSLSCRSTEVFQKRSGRWVNIGAHVDSGQ